MPERILLGDILVLLPTDTISQLFVHPSSLPYHVHNNAPIDIVHHDILGLLPTDTIQQQSMILRHAFSIVIAVLKMRLCSIILIS